MHGYLMVLLSLIDLIPPYPFPPLPLPCQHRNCPPCPALVSCLQLGTGPLLRPRPRGRCDADLEGRGIGVWYVDHMKNCHPRCTTWKIVTPCAPREELSPYSFYMKNYHPSCTIGRIVTPSFPKWRIGTLIKFSVTIIYIIRLGLDRLGYIW